MTKRKPLNLLTPNTDLTDDTPPRANRRRRLFLILLGVCAALALYSLYNFSVAMALKRPDYANKLLAPKQWGWFDTVKSLVLPGTLQLAGSADDRINILLLGIGGEGHEGKNLSDTNIIVSIQPSTHEVAMVSIPRDLSVNIPGAGWRKINAVNAFGEESAPGQGAAAARDFFSQTFGIPIQYYIRVDFKAFVDLVNSVGGITINVPRSFTDYQYPGPNYSYETISFTEGVQHMDGETALKYARSRHGGSGEGSDFARSRRQQQALLALKEKLLSFGTYANPVTVKRIFSAVESNISTNLSIQEMVYLASFAQDVNQSTIKNIVFDDAPGGYLVSTIGEDGAYLLLPRTGNFNEMAQVLHNVFASSTLISASGGVAAPLLPRVPVKYGDTAISIDNGTWEIGLAARARQRLEQKGFRVAGIGNSPMRPMTVTQAYLIHSTASSSTLRALTDLLGTIPQAGPPSWPTTTMSSLPSAATVTTTPSSSSTLPVPSGLPYPPGTDILIILGTDKASQW